MQLSDEIKQILETVLQLNGRSREFNESSLLLGALPELDSMAVVSVLTTLEDRFGFIVDDDEISADTFATFGTLSAFVEQKLHG
jgi:acyl carrier protein